MSNTIKLNHIVAKSKGAVKLVDILFNKKHSKWYCTIHLWVKDHLYVNEAYGNSKKQSRDYASKWLLSVLKIYHGIYIVKTPIEVVKVAELLNKKNKFSLVNQYGKHTEWKLFSMIYSTKTGEWSNQKGDMVTSNDMLNMLQNVSFKNHDCLFNVASTRRQLLINGFLKNKGLWCVDPDDQGPEYTDYEDCSFDPVFSLLSDEKKKEILDKELDFMAQERQQYYNNKTNFHKEYNLIPNNSYETCHDHTFHQDYSLNKVPDYFIQDLTEGGKYVESICVIHKSGCCNLIFKGLYGVNAKALDLSGKEFLIPIGSIDSFIPKK